MARCKAARRSRPVSWSSVSFSAASDAVTVPDSPAFRITQDVTLNAWINVNAFSRFMEIVMRGDSRQFLDPYLLRAHDGLARSTLRMPARMP